MATGSLRRVCVVGGGAAGFYSAVACAEALRSCRATRDVKVLILEKSAHVLHKVRISGGGRCNVTHGHGVAASAGYPRGAELVATLGARHGASDAARWFTEHGVPLKTEADGRVFPTSDSSASVVNCLEGAAEALGVEVRTGARVHSLERFPDGVAAELEPRFRLAVEGGESAIEELDCSRVILCCGSAQTRSVQRLLESAGATLRPTAPSLFSLLAENLQESGLEGLEGVSVPDARIGLVGVDLGADAGDVAEERGALLVTHGGLSGPAVLRLSAWGAFALQRVAYRARVRIDWAPFLESPLTAAEAIEAVPAGRTGPGGQPPVRRKAVGEVSPWPGRLPARLWRRLLELSGPKGSELAEQPWGRIRTPGAALHLAETIWPQVSGHELVVNGRRPNKEEFVTAGGVDWRKALDLDRLESVACPGVHFAGEVLDVDGITGGFNFQNCWTTGHAAGTAVAMALCDQSGPSEAL